MSSPAPSRPRNDLIDTLLHPATRQPVSSVPPAFPGDRSRSLEEMGAELRARAAIGLRKCGSSSPDERPSKKRAKRAYEHAVEASGGASAVARESVCDESAVRLRVEHPKRHPQLAHCYELAAAGMAIVITDLVEAMEEKLRGAARVG